MPTTSARAHLSIPGMALRMAIDATPKTPQRTLRAAGTAGSIAGPAGFTVDVLRFDDVVANGVPHKFRGGMAVEAFHDVGPMRLGRLDADAQTGGNFLAGLTFGNKPENLFLAWRKT